MKPSAIGDWLVIVPYGDKWQVAALSKAMRYKSSTVNLTLEEARKHRTELMAHHKKLAKEYAKRKRI